MIRTLHRLLPATLAPLALTCLAGNAGAQQIGLYTGTTSQGNNFEVRVVDDGFGNPLLESLTVFWTATCTKSGPGRGVAWGVGSGAPIVDRKIAAEYRFNMLYEKFDLKFNASGSSVTGKFQARTPEFEDATNSVSSVERCDSGALTLSGDYQVPSGAEAKRAKLAAGEARRIER